MAHMHPRVFVIIVNYNARRTLMQTLTSVFRLAGPPAEIVLVDNNSSDGSFEEARQRFPRIHFIQNNENQGFAAGVNIGIHFALERLADLMLLLNPDAVLQPDTLAILMQFFRQHPSAGIASPLIFDRTGTCHWFVKGRINWWRLRTEHEPGDAPKQPTRSDYVPGCAMLIRKSVIADIGYLDERYFLYYEDADYCWRARAAGWECWVVPAAHVIHSETSEEQLPRKTYWLVRSGLLFFSDHSKSLRRAWFRCFVAVRRVKNMVDRLVHPNASGPRAVHNAYRDFARTRNER